MGKIPEDPRSSEKVCLGDQLEALVEVQEQADEGLNIGSDRGLWFLFAQPGIYDARLCKGGNTELGQVVKGKTSSILDTWSKVLRVLSENSDT